MVRYTKNTRPEGLLVVAAALLLVGVAAGLYWFQPWRLWTNVAVDDALPVLTADVSARTSIDEAPSRAASRAPMASLTPDSSASAMTAAPESPPVVAPPLARPPVESSAVATPPTEPLERATAALALTTRTGRSKPEAEAVAPGVTARKAAVLAKGQLISHEHRTSGTIQIVQLADGHRVLTIENLRTSDGPALRVWLTDAPVIDGEDGWNIFDDGRHADLGDLKGNIGNQVYQLPDDLDLTQYRSMSIWCERFSVSFGAAELGEVQNLSPG